MTFYENRMMTDKDDRGAMSFYDNRMMKHRRGTGTKRDSVDLLAKWEATHKANSNHRSVSIARKRLDLAIAEQPLTITINRMKT
jgi:hypothetical protein